MTLTVGLLTGCSWGPCGPHVITREEYREHREAKRRDAEIKKKSPTEKPDVEAHPWDDGISDQDRAEIAAVIKLETDQAILMLHRDFEDPELIRVNTGYSATPLGSSGKFFVVAKKNSQWVVISRGMWAS